MASTIGQIIQRAAYEGQLSLPQGISSFVGQVNTTALQLLNLTYATGRELRQSRWWPQLKRSYTVILKSGRSRYNLPADYYAAIPDTTWDNQNKWRMRGPLSDATWTARKFGYVVVENRRGFRVFGPDINTDSGGGQFEVDPVPGDSDAGLFLSFDYLSKNWISPPLWRPGEDVLGASYRMSYGNYYQTSAGGICGDEPLTYNRGFGQDGAVRWLLVEPTAWAINTLYAAGSYVLNGGLLYVCIEGGTSAGAGGPTGTGDNIVDNTVRWENKSFTSWVGQTNYVQGQHIESNSNYYRCVIPGKSGNLAPNWDATEQSDGTVDWSYVDRTYDRALSDNDLCLFDEELMILGLKWRILQAKGLDYADLRGEYESMRDAAVARFQSGGIISLGGGGFYPSGLFPNVPVGSFTF